MNVYPIAKAVQTEDDWRHDKSGLAEFHARESIVELYEVYGEELTWELVKVYFYDAVTGSHTQ